MIDHDVNEDDNDDLDIDIDDNDLTQVDPTLAGIAAGGSTSKSLWVGSVTMGHTWDVKIIHLLEEEKQRHLITPILMTVDENFQIPPDSFQ